jgi:hypothetical protein
MNGCHPATRVPAINSTVPCRLPMRTGYFSCGRRTQGNGGNGIKPFYSKNNIKINNKINDGLGI